MTAKIDLDLGTGPGSRRKVLINGEDIANHVTSVTVYADATSPTEVTLTLFGHVTVTADGVILYGTPELEQSPDLFPEGNES